MSPILGLRLEGTESALCRVRFVKDARQLTEAGPPSNPLVEEAKRQLTAYFAGKLREFSLPLQPAGTPFQQQVWRELRKIPYGATATYADLARRIGRPGAVRAVGAANARNPIPIVIPCHRVVGSDGRLTGYGGGLDLKAALLALEKNGDTILFSDALPNPLSTRVYRHAGK